MRTTSFAHCLTIEDGQSILVEVVESDELRNIALRLTDEDFGSTRVAITPEHAKKLGELLVSVAKEAR